ncbi:STAS domain-containing protein [Kitasatospora terrestris]|uniref:STAS domain-containing protein n=1 Tax=Kitasatospora terrestris TaxID=258051 RepID=A0ABP9EFC8_9ACTN
MTVEDSPLPADRTVVGGMPDAAITVTNRDGSVVCALAGALHHDNVGQVRRALNRALRLQPGVLAVDLSAVDLLTSAGLNALLTVRREALERGVRLVVVAPSRPARHVLRITQVDTVLPMAPTLEHALRDGGEDPPAREG